MECPHCYLTMFEIDDCGDGSQGYECDGCGLIISENDEPCPQGNGTEPCYGTDGPHGETVCACCGREM